MRPLIFTLVAASLLLTACAPVTTPTPLPTVEPTLVVSPISPTAAATATLTLAPSPQPTQAATAPPTVEPTPASIAATPLCAASDTFSPLGFIDSARILGRGIAGVNIFNLKTLREEAYLQYPAYVNFEVDPSGAPPAIALAPDGQIMAWAPEKTYIQLVRLSDKKVINTFKAQSAIVIDLEFSAAGDKLFVLLGDGTFMAWGLEGKVLYSIQTGYTFFGDQGMGVSPDERLLAFFTLFEDQALLVLWDLFANKKVGEYRGDMYGVGRHTAFSPDGQWVGNDSAPIGNPPSLWRVADGALVWKGQGYGDFGFAPDGQTVAVSSLDKDNNGVAMLLATDTAELRHSLAMPAPPHHIPHNTVSGFIFSADNTQVVASAGPELRVWQVADGALLAACRFPEPRPLLAPTPDTVACAAPAITPVAFLDNTHLLGWSATGFSRLTVDTLEKEADLLTVENAHFAGLSPDGQILAMTLGSSSRDAALQLIRLSDQKVLGTFASNVDDFFSNAVFSPAGDRVFISGPGGKVNVLDLTGQLVESLAVFPDPDLRIDALALSPDGTLLAAYPRAAGLRRFGVWDLVNHQPVAPRDEAAALAAWHAAGGGGLNRWLIDLHIETLSPDGQWTATYTDKEDTAPVITLTSATARHDLTQPASVYRPVVFQLLFSPDSQKLVATYTSEIAVWQVADGQLLHACNTAYTP